MIPTAILAGLLLGLWVRWWAVPIVAVGWAVVIALVMGPTSALGGAALGAINALVGVLPAVGLRKLFEIAAGDGQRSSAR